MATLSLDKIILVGFISTSSLLGNTPIFLKNKGDLYKKENQLLLALDYYKKSLQKNPNFVPSLIEIGKIQRENAVYKAALNYFKKALFINPKNLLALKETAETYIELSDIKNALKIIQEASQLYPHNPDLNHLLAKVYSTQNRKFLALKKLQKNLKIYPKHFPSLMTLAKVYIEQLRFDKANQVLKKAILIQPENPKTLILKAELAIDKIIKKNGMLLFDEPIESKIFIESIEFLLNAIGYDKKHVRANYLLGQVYAISRDCKSAQPYFKKVFHRNPNHYGAQTWLAFCNKNEIEKRFPRMLTQNPNDEILKMALEMFYLKKYSPKVSPQIMRLVDEHFSEAKTLLQANYFKEYLHEVQWSLYLYPYYLKARDELLQYHRSRGDFFSIRSQLDILLKHTKKQKYQDQFELWINTRRKKLFYKEDYQDLEKIKTPTPIFVFNFYPENPFTQIPDAGSLIARKLNFAFKSIPTIASIPDSIDLKTRSTFEKMNYLGKGGYFNAKLASKLDTQLNQFLRPHQIQNIQYVIAGNYRSIYQGISTNIRLINIHSGETLAKFSSQTKGRGYLRKLIVDLAQKIEKKTPFYGRILKLKNSQILLNVGFREKFKKNSKVLILRNGRQIAKAKIIKSEFDLSLANTINNSNFYFLRVGDQVILQD